MKQLSDLHPYQCEGVDFLRLNPFGAVWLDLGMGKTVIVLTAIAAQKEDGWRERTLLVAPLRVAMTTWPNEIGEWGHTRSLTYTVVRAFGNEPEVRESREMSRAVCRRFGFNAGAVQRISERAARRGEERVRERLLREKTDIHIINREAVPWLVKKWGKRWPYTRIVYDEASGLRDHTTERVKALVAARKNVISFWELTGTPAPETYIDLFPQIYLLDQGQRFGKSLGKFRARYFDHNVYARKYEIKEGSADRIIDAIGDIALVMKAEDYLPVNHPIVTDRMVEMTEEQSAAYTEFEENLVLELDELDIVAETAAALSQKLLQYASGAVYDENKNVHPIHDHKLAELQDIISEAQGSPVLVAYWFKSSLARLKAMFPQGRTIGKTGQAQADWTAGKIPVMFVHPASEGHGLNLQYGGHILVFFDIPYSLELYLQIIGRIARQGQKKVPLIIHLVTRGTVDAGIVPLLRGKKRVQDYLLNRVKRLRAAKDL
jgi:SNF2 family DNA or RNA helicase